MRSAQALLAALLAVGCLNAGGCYLATTDTKPTMNAYTVADDFQYMRKGKATEPAAKQLTPLAEVIVVPYFYDVARPKRERRRTVVQRKARIRRTAIQPKVEILPAVRAKPGQSIPFPIRLHAEPVLGPPRWIPQGVFVFAEGCWPVMYNQNATGGPSRWKSVGPIGLYFGLRGTLASVLYRQSRPYGHPVLDALRSDCLSLILTDHWDELTKAIDESPNLRPADRMMVYKTLQPVFEAAWQQQPDGRTKRLYVYIRQMLREKITILSVPAK